VKRYHKGLRKLATKDEHGGLHLLSVLLNACDKDKEQEIQEHFQEKLIN
jgi:hypothetical protein